MKCLTLIKRFENGVHDGCRPGSNTRHVDNKKTRPCYRPCFVPKEGIEPSHLAVHDFESCASTNSATLASVQSLSRRDCAPAPTSVAVGVYQFRPCLLRLCGDRFGEARPAGRHFSFFRGANMPKLCGPAKSRFPNLAATPRTRYLRGCHNPFPTTARRCLYIFRSLAIPDC
jgi:hypothetical protein